MDVNAFVNNAYSALAEKYKVTLVFSLVYLYLHLKVQLHLHSLKKYKATLVFSLVYLYLRINLRNSAESVS